jgi:hypothetical protein
VASSIYSNDETCAEFRTDFLNVTNKCLKFYYRWISSAMYATLRVYLRYEDQTLELIKEIPAPNIETASSIWNAVFVALPTRRGFQQIIVRFIRAAYMFMSIDLAIDDLTVRSCADFGKF